MITLIDKTILLLRLHYGRSQWTPESGLERDYNKSYPAIHHVSSLRWEIALINITSPAL